MFLDYREINRNRFSIRHSLHVAFFVFLSLTALAASAACTTGTEEEEDRGDIVTVGQALPDFTVTLSDGAEVSPTTLSGHPAVICFFNTSCSDCRKELPIIQQLYDEVSASVAIVCISRAETAESIASYWQTNGLTLPYSAQTDCSVYERFATRTIPRVYVCDAAGIVRATFVEKASLKKLREAVTACSE